MTTLTWNMYVSYRVDKYGIFFLLLRHGNT